jgi:hypothetical protein
MDGNWIGRLLDQFEGTNGTVGTEPGLPCAPMRPLPAGWASTSGGTSVFRAWQRVFRLQVGSHSPHRVAFDRPKEAIGQLLQAGGEDAVVRPARASFRMAKARRLASVPVS